MEFSHIDNHFDSYFVYFKARMKRCRGCGNFMLDTTDESLTGMEVVQLRNKDVRICTDETGVCEACQKKGDYPLQCSICKHYKKFPAEFKYRATEYAEYEDGYTTEYLICIDCVANHPQKVISILADADDVETVSR